AAEDYVRRYVRFTNRYGSKAGCIEARTLSGTELVDVAARSRGGDGCPKEGTILDVFEVNVTADRMSLVDPDTHAPLKKWADGSDPEGPPGAGLEEDVNGWRGPVKDALAAARALPIRVQHYGRGTFLVVTIAAWTPSLAPDAGARASTRRSSRRG